MNPHVCFGILFLLINLILLGRYHENHNCHSIVYQLRFYRYWWKKNSFLFGDLRKSKSNIKAWSLLICTKWAELSIIIDNYTCWKLIPRIVKIITTSKLFWIKFWRKSQIGASHRNSQETPYYISFCIF